MLPCIWKSEENHSGSIAKYIYGNYGPSLINAAAELTIAIVGERTFEQILSNCSIFLIENLEIKIVSLTRLLQRGSLHLRLCHTVSWLK